jgi:hypothetical protein
MDFGVVLQTDPPAARVADIVARYLQHDAKDATPAGDGELVVPQVDQREAATV